MKTTICAIVLLPLSASAVPILTFFEWTGDLGYSVEATFTYDDAYPTIVGVPPSDPNGNVGLSDLFVSVFDPAGDLLDSGSSASGGVSDYPWLSFSFESASKDFTPGSFLDMGSDPGYWLQAYPSDPGSFKLWGRTFEIDPDGSSALVDSGGSYRLFSNAVADGGSSVAMLTAAGMAILFLHRRMQRAPGPRAGPPVRRALPPATHLK